MSDSIVELLDRMQNEDAQQRMNNLASEKRWRSIPRDAGEFLGVIVRSTKSKNIVEIGTSQGYSTIWLGLAALSTDGKVISFETEEWRYTQAVENIKLAGLEATITLVHGDITSKADKLPSKIDLLFLDSEKSDYLGQLRTLFDRIIDGGVILADNIVSHFADLREYVEYVRNHPRLNSLMLSSIGNGMELTYKMAPSEPDTVPWNVLVR